MGNPDRRVETESKPEEVLRLIAVSAEELTRVVHEGDESDVSDTIARLLSERLAA